MSYKRLTKEKITKDDVILHRNIYGNIIISQEVWDMLEKEHNQLAELEDKIENGTLVELPCPIRTMTDEKQIEEMAKDIYYAIRNECKLNTCGNCNDCEFNVPEKTNEIGCLSYLVGKILTQMNYRKIPEGAVVLTREEWECLHNDYAKALYNARQNERKETVREIADWLDNEKGYCGLGYLVKRQYGVEIKE